MSDVDARLARADPVVGQRYEHPDLERMITRVTRVDTGAATSRVWRTFQLRVAGALAASALVTVGAIAAIQGAGSGLSVLTLAATGFSPVVTTGAFASASLAPMAHATFVGSSSLSSEVPSTLSYRLATPSSPSKETARLASIFKVTGTPVETTTPPAQWTVHDSRGDQLTYSDEGVPYWSFSGVAPSAPGRLPSHATIEGDARAYVRELGYGYQLATPTFTTLQATAGTTIAPSPLLTVRYGLSVAHVATGQSLSLEVNAANRVVRAAGPSFVVHAGLAYPLQSPRDAVREASRAKASSVEKHGSVARRPSASAVALTHASLSLRAYRLTDGTLWLLPVYTLRGAHTGARTLDNGLLILALQPRYVAIRPGSSVTTPSILNP